MEEKRQLFALNNNKLSEDQKENEYMSVCLDKRFDISEKLHTKPLDCVNIGTKIEITKLETTYKGVRKHLIDVGDLYELSIYFNNYDKDRDTYFFITKPCDVHFGDSDIPNIPNIKDTNIYSVVLNVINSEGFELPETSDIIEIPCINKKRNDICKLVDGKVTFIIRFICNPITVDMQYVKERTVVLQDENINIFGSSRQSSDAHRFDVNGIRARIDHEWSLDIMFIGEKGCGFHTTPHPLIFFDCIGSKDSVLNEMDSSNNRFRRSKVCEINEKRSRKKLVNGRQAYYFKQPISRDMINNTISLRNYPPVEDLYDILTSKPHLIRIRTANPNRVAFRRVNQIVPKKINDLISISQKKESIVILGSNVPIGAKIYFDYTKAISFDEISQEYRQVIVPNVSTVMRDIWLIESVRGQNSDISKPGKDKFKNVKNPYYSFLGMQNHVSVVTILDKDNKVIANPQLFIYGFDECFITQSIKSLLSSMQKPDIDMKDVYAKDEQEIEEGEEQNEIDAKLEQEKKELFAMVSKNYPRTAEIIFFILINRALRQNKDYFDNTDDLGRTILHYLAIRGFKCCIAIILAYNPKAINIDDIFHVTPLHIAVKRGYYNLTKLMLLCGANVNAKDCNGDTPMDIAKAKNDNPIISLLKQYADVEELENKIQGMQIDD